MAGIRVTPGVGRDTAKQDEIEEQTLARNKESYRDIIAKYDKCKALGIEGRGWRAIGREHGTPGVCELGVT